MHKRTAQIAFIRIAFILPVLAMGGMALATLLSLQPPERLTLSHQQENMPVMTDRRGIPLVPVRDRGNQPVWLVPLYDMPELLVQAFVFSEDRRFYQHNGIDAQALAGAVWQNIRALARVRGGSTITEQVVRIRHQRPRTLWAKWLEKWEALALERHNSKHDILEYYLNQLPYAANRQGVVQAASWYFDRDTKTLNDREMLALVVMARAPSRYDLYRAPGKIDSAIDRLAQQMYAANLIDQTRLEHIMATKLAPQRPIWSDQAGHFVSWARRNLDHIPPMSRQQRLRTTLDSHLQQQIQDIIDQRLAHLRRLSVHNAAAMVVDHRDGRILAYVVAGGDTSTGARAPNYAIDAVQVPRQPGSALKPFLYAAALARGWTAATMIDDSPMAEMVGSGLHEFRNYSHSFYGPLSLREALGNSLNIPALRTIGFVGARDYLALLQRLGITSLDRSADYYREGLALGSAEISLYQMVQAYTVLAARGQFRPLRFALEQDFSRAEQIFSPEIASLIGHILSDPWARQREFGYYSVLNLPVQTAIKTGTSTDYRDAWTLGFDSRYVVGVWMGDLNHLPMDGVTGAIGPALAVRSIFSILNQDQQTRPLYLSPLLTPKPVCAGQDCVVREEYFLPGTGPDILEQAAPPIRITRPVQGLQMAWDPRIPAAEQYFSFRLEGLDGQCPQEKCTIQWHINNQSPITTATGSYRWPVQRGNYTLRVSVLREKQPIFEGGPIQFVVK